MRSTSFRPEIIVGKPSALSPLERAVFTIRSTAQRGEFEACRVALLDALAAVDAEIEAMAALDYLDNVADVFEDADALTPVEIEAGERWEAMENRKAASQVAADNRFFKADLNARGVDVVDYCHEAGLALDSVEAESIAKRAGYRQTTWNDSRNITRREKLARRKVRQAGQLARLATAQRRGD